MFIKWLIDTGCAHDLLSEKDAQRLGARGCTVPLLTFETAGGLVSTDKGAKVWIPEFQEEVQPHALATGTPAVLSVGARCMEMGYSFIWMAGHLPYFIKPNGWIVRLEVSHNIPYLRPGRQICQPAEPKQVNVVPGVPGVTVDAPSMEQQEPMEHVEDLAPGGGARSVTVPESTDHWIAHDDKVIRIHWRPRRALFTPEDTGCPVDIAQLTSARVTHYQFDDGEWHVLEDIWSGPESDKFLGKKWTEETV